MDNLKPKLATTFLTKFPLFLAKWLLLSLPIGFLVGSASALFLWSLNWVTNYRENHIWLIALLPLGGLIIGLAYHYFGENVVKGNNLLLEEFNSPKQIIPFRMAPLVLFGTLVTHLFGGSAGREGTAVQMGGAIADLFTKWFGLTDADRKVILIMGISAGVASVFGTPLAGAVFALEVMALTRVKLWYLIPSVIVAFVADYSCAIYPIAHTHYHITEIPDITFTNAFYTIGCAILFGLAALLFSKTVHFFSTQFKRFIAYPPLRPVLGGVVIALVVWALGTTKYIGLGVPTIVEAFSISEPPYAFLLKLLLTTFTLGAGFKGGEVTPLFFIGATLGSALFMIIPLPLSLLAGMGFIAVFSGATHTPVACTIMGLELFGTEGALYLALACAVAYLFSGTKGIYSSQQVGGTKGYLYSKIKKDTGSTTLPEQ
nr:voltage-gated chloride channel family protein [uncultured Flavobacterium sp.]